jgi:hypothetical protein
MNPEVVTIKESDFVLRRPTEELPLIALALPIVFALVIVLVFAFYRSKGKLTWLGIGAGAVAAGGLLFFVVSYALRDALSWWLVLVPTMILAFAYIAMMYQRDAHSIHYLLAAFLGMVRAAVYCLLAFCFLLPGCQEFDTTVTASKVLLMIDVSGSMSAVDGHESGAGITRLEKMVRFLAAKQAGTGKTFIEQLTESSPVTCYRFGTTVDDEPVNFDAKATAGWSDEQWRAWLKVNEQDITPPQRLEDDKQRADYIASRKALYAQLREGTDIGGSVLQALQREGNNRVQAVIVLSDGNSNRGDEEAIRQVLERAANPKRGVHILTVGVGDFKQPVRIRINPLVAPQVVRADDGAFEVRVPVYGDGLPGEEVEVTLQAQRVKDRIGIQLDPKKEPLLLVGKQKAKFGGGGEFPFDEVVFKVNLEQITKIKAQEDSKGVLQGTWNFVASVPRHRLEAPDKEHPEHLSPNRPVIVNDSTLRVLLFASGPSRDYQFLRTLLAREVENKRAKLSVYLQTSKGLEDVQQDVDGSHLLNDFPNRLERPKDGKKEDRAKEGDPMNLKSYDVIVAFDPDWKQLTKNQKDLLKEWVEGEHGGGLIFIAGPQYMQTLIPPVDEAKFNAWDMKSVFALFPVVLARPPANVRPDAMHDASIPYTLEFTGIAKGYDFLKLDDDSNVPLGGWKEFFGKYVADEGPGAKVHPERGFFNYFRVVKSKDGAEVIATFNDPKSPKTADGKAQPFFVSMRAGKGKSFYVGSGELWRLRSFREDFHQRLWVKLARFVSSGSGAKSFGRFAMAGEYVTGIIPIEAEVRDKDGFPLGADASPLVTVKRLDAAQPKDEKLPTTQLKAKKGLGNTRGVFVGSLRLDRDGVYEVRIDIPGTDESITQAFELKPPNVEMSDLRTNFPKLYGLATDATPAMLERLDPNTRAMLEAGQERPKSGGSVAGPRLFFRLAAAEAISRCITKVPAERESVKGALRNLWDRGPEVFKAQSWEELPWLLAAMYGLPAVIFLTGVALMLMVGRTMAAVGVLATLLVVEGGLVALVFTTVPSEVFQPSALGVLLVVPPLILLATAGILVVAERYGWAMSVLAGMVVYLACLLAIEYTLTPDWPPMKIDFTWILIAVGFLLSVEWFTRKMLRLA